MPGFETVRRVRSPGSLEFREANQRGTDLLRFESKAQVRPNARGMLLL